jgi:ATP-dependent RNA helicase RhlE
MYMLRRKGKVSLRDNQALIFARTKKRAERVMVALQEKGVLAGVVHKELSNMKKEQVVSAFTEGKIQVCTFTNTLSSSNARAQILVSTDLMARGIDIRNLPYVINYDVTDAPRKDIISFKIKHLTR